MTRVQKNEVQTPLVNSLVEMDRRHVWHPFTQAFGADDPIVIRSGRGALLTTDDGREILDCISSWWVNLFGHGRPEIADAIARQAQQLEHVIFAGFTHEPAIQLAEKLAGLLPGDLNRVFFSDNGSTSVEVALKIAAQYWQNIGVENRHRVLAFDGGYHGDTVGAMSAGVGSGFFDAWKRWMIEVDVIPFPETWQEDSEVAEKEQRSLAVLDRFLEQYEDEVVVMILEPLVQGASGMRMCRPSFLQAVVQRLRDRDIPVIFDEVMTGFGRTGEDFACNLANLQPDLICLSKGLTGGFLPMGVTVASDRIYESFLFDSPRAMFCHGHSYTANPLGCAAALASLDLLQTEETRDNWRRIAIAHQAGLESLSSRQVVTRARQLGTIAAVNIATNRPGYHSNVSHQLKSWFREENELVDDVLIRPLGNVVYMMPPYCMTDEQLTNAWQAVATAIQQFSDNS